ncbi:nucleotidyltransferase family protein [Leyella stercorea]|uniref:nucleotidyltransferase family protein n=1 Tax=Leyella stercorea TaxID=363265 RepID=UPI00266D25EA|nr:nucleotidyltransferase family protein [Leyella stercorea]
MDSCIDKVENALLEILRREVTGEDGTEKMELSVAGLNAVMRLAREHAVTGLVANAAMRNRIVIAGGVAEGRGEVVMRLMQQTMAHRQNQRRFEDAVGRFARLMKENSIAYVVFKGVAVARHYPEPFVRTMGDVDFYVPKSCFDRAVEVIERGLNVVMDKEEVDKHYSFDWQGIRFEMHYQIETFGNHRHQHRFDRMIDEAMAEHADSFTVCDSDGNETEVSVLPPTEDLIVVFKHWFNHLLVEGVGLRQTLDLAVLLNAYRDKINVGRLMTALDGIGYMKAFRAMLAMLKRYFGFEWLDSNFVLGCRDERYADKLMAAVMESGNFGRKAYRNHTTGKKKSMETATRALRHCVTFLRLAPKDILCLIPRRIGITLKQKF